MSTQLIAYAANQVDERRKSLGLTVNQVSEALGIHPNTWGNWKRNGFKSCQIGDLIKIMNYFETVESRQKVA